jgi:hypothetical protein
MMLVPGVVGQAAKSDDDEEFEQVHGLSLA